MLKGYTDEDFLTISFLSLEAIVYTCTEQ